MIAMPLVSILWAVGLIGISIAGEVVDSKGKPVPGAEVAFSVGMTRDGAVPVMRRTETDHAGRFHFPRLANESLEGSDAPGTIWVDKPGLGLGVMDLLRDDRRDQVHRIVLEPEAPRRLTIQDATGRPVAGLRVSPRVLQRDRTRFEGILVPDDWFDRMSAVTDSMGRADLPGLTRVDDLRSIRVTLPDRTSLPLMIPYAKSKEAVTLVVGQPGRVTGQVRDARGRPITGAVVEVWVRSALPLEGAGFLYGIPEHLSFDEPVRTGSDGTFQTPARLRIGSTVRVVVRSGGFVPLVSDWLLLKSETTTLPPLSARPYRVIEGRAVDRQGKPVQGAEVRQSPGGSRCLTDEAGRFRLAQARDGRSFLVAHKQEFRFCGQPIDEQSAEPITVTMTRSHERPVRLMSTLADQIPLAESRNLARRVLDPVLREAVTKGDDASKLWLLRVFRWLDPPAVLEQIEKIKFDRTGTSDFLKGEAAIGIVDVDPTEAVSVAETIADPALRAGTLVDICDALPRSERTVKLKLLDQAATQVRKAATELEQVLSDG